MQMLSCVYKSCVAGTAPEAGSCTARQAQHIMECRQHTTSAAVLQGCHMQDECLHWLIVHAQQAAAINVSIDPRCTSALPSEAAACQVILGPWLSRFVDSLQNCTVRTAIGAAGRHDQRSPSQVSVPFA